MKFDKIFHFFSIAIIAVALVLACGCGSSDDDDTGDAVDITQFAVSQIQNATNDNTDTVDTSNVNFVGDSDVIDAPNNVPDPAPEPR